MTKDLRAWSEGRDFRFCDVVEEKKAVDYIHGVIEANRLTRVLDETRRQHWDDAWGAHLACWRRTRKVEDLVPAYLQEEDSLLRWKQHFVVPLTTALRLRWYRDFIGGLAKSWFIPSNTVYEFGTGSGINLMYLATVDASKSYVGLDWSLASNQLLNEIGEFYHLPVRGRWFDLLHPDPNVHLVPGSAVLTVGALEQTGEYWKAFLDYLLGQPVSICVNVEPVLELYDPDNAVDRSAIDYHLARGYWEGFPARLRELERQEKVEVLRIRRNYFGTLFTEGYNELVWRPT